MRHGLLMLTLPLLACTPAIERAAMFEGVVSGTAANAKGGAVIQSDDGRVIYFIGLDSWPDDVRDKAVTARGKVGVRKHIPDPVVTEDGAISQGAVGDQWVLDDAEWSVHPALPARGGTEWAAMGRALVSACERPEGELGQLTCQVLLDSWQVGPAIIRRAATVREHWDDEVMVTVSTGGMWHTVVFDPNAAWKVVGFDNGDIR